MQKTKKPEPKKAAPAAAGAKTVDKAPSVKEALEAIKEVQKPKPPKDYGDCGCGW